MATSRSIEASPSALICGVTDNTSGVIGTKFSVEPVPFWLEESLLCEVLEFSDYLPELTTRVTVVPLSTSVPAWGY